MAPVEDVRVPGLLQEIERRVALRDPRGEPALRGAPLLAPHALGALADERALLRLGEFGLAIGVGVTMGDDLVAAPPERCDHLGAVVVERSVDQRANRQ